MKQILTLLLSTILFLHANAETISYQDATDYRPLLELGKEWRYNVHEFGIAEPKPDEKMVLRLDSCFEANGITYYQMRQYYNDSDTPDDTEHSIREYLWEDLETRTVWFTWKVNEDGSTISKSLLYDFIDPSNSIYCPEDGEVMQFESFDGMHRAYPVWDGTLLLAEGLGVIGYARSVYDEDTPWCAGTLLSENISTAPFAAPCASFNCRMAVLYEIADGNGEVIYSVPSAYPDKNSGLLQPSSASKATVTENELRISSDREIGTVTITSTSGAIVLNAYVAENEFRYSIGALAPGIYLLTYDGATQKFVVR